MYLHAMLPLVVKCEALCRALALIIAATLADAVDVAPVRLRLRVLQRVAVHLGRAKDTILASFLRRYQGMQLALSTVSNKSCLSQAPSLLCAADRTLPTL